MSKRGLNMTEDQYAAHQAKFGRGQKPQLVIAPAEAKIIRQSGKGPNKTELRFENDYLRPWKIAGEIVSYRAQSLTLLLANGVRYTPDWHAIAKDGLLSLFEIKGGGPLRDDAVVKMKCCAAGYPEFPLWLYRWIAGEWQIQRVKA